MNNLWQLKMKSNKLFSGILIAVLLIVTPSLATNIAKEIVIEGKVIAITDGDTIELLNKDKQTFKIRFAEIDSPEKDQPYGQKSKQALSDLIYSEKVQVIQSDIDRYGRVVGYVYFNEQNINLEMVKLGMAWVYTYYSKDEKFREAENEARAKKVGIWSLQEDQIMPPWEWRRKR